MSGISTRRARLLRLRTIEHRVAAARQAKADAACNNLSQISQRLSMLRVGLGTSKGGTTGLALKSMTEMSARLDNATHSMVEPINEAESRLSEYRHLRLQARQKEEGAAKLHDRARYSEENDRIRRDETNRPYRKRDYRLD